MEKYMNASNPVVDSSVANDYDLALQAEKYLATSEFRQALSLSILFLKQQSAATDNLLENQQQHTSSAAAVDPSKYFNKISSLSKETYETENLLITMNTPLALDHKKHCSRYKHSDDSMTAKWKIQLTDEKSQMDRVTAVAIQSIYEISKDEEQSSETSFLRESLEPFFSVYRSFEISMPLELAVLWIQFCYTVESVNTAAFASLEILSKILFCFRTGSLDVDPASEHWILEHCEDLLFLLMVQILPYMQSSMVETILDNIWKVRDDKEDKTEECHTFDIHLSIKNPNVESVTAIIRFLNHVTSNIPLLTDCIEECIDNLQKMVREMDHKCLPSSSSEKGKSISVNETKESKISSGLSASEDTMDGDGEYSIKKQVKKYVLNDLWSGDNRWTNRGRLALVAFLTYVAWEKRRKIASISRSSGKAIIGPFREIIEAFIPT